MAVQNQVLKPWRCILIQTARQEKSRRLCCVVHIGICQPWSTSIRDPWWLVVDPTLWKIWVSWDDDIPNWMEKIKFMFQSPPTSITTSKHFNINILPCVSGPVKTYGMRCNGTIWLRWAHSPCPPHWRYLGLSWEGHGVPTRANTRRSRFTEVKNGSEIQKWKKGIIEPRDFPACFQCFLWFAPCAVKSLWERRCGSET